MSATLVVSGSARAAAILVDPNESGAYDTIQDAVGASGSGDTIEVAPSTYHEQVDIPHSLAIIGAPGDEGPGPADSAPVLDGQNQRHHGFGIAEEVVDVTIQGFEIKNYEASPGVGVGIGGTRATTNVTIEHNLIHDVGNVGITAAAREDSDLHEGWVVEANLVENYPGTGINLENMSSGTVMGNEVVGGGQGEGIVLSVKNEGGDLPTVRVDLTGNTIEHNTVGIRVGGGVEPSEIAVHENSITDNDVYGTVNDGTETLTAERNWWGARTGPTRAAGKSGQEVGDGDRVSEAVDFTPWLTKPP